MTGDDVIKRRELAAFFGQTSQETSGRWIIGEDAQFTWGYCFVNELNPKSDYCDPNTNSSYPCAAGKHYYGRGPLQLRWNHNYGRLGKELNRSLLYQPEKVATDQVLSIRGSTLVLDDFTFSSECTKDKETWEQNRIAYYLRYCDMLDVDAGEYIDCDNQEPFGDNGLLKMVGSTM
ncbi:hypothetical protein Peur_015129 [Populus x canadensis]